MMCQEALKEIRQINICIRAMRVVCIYICITLSFSAHGQNMEQTSIDVLLQKEGFEDIQSRQMADTLYLSIEDRAHRGTFRGAGAAIKQVAECHPDIQCYEVVLKDYTMPQLIVHASKRGDIWDVSVDRDMEQAVQMLKDVETQRASYGKIDVTVYPMISLVNNKLDHLFDYSVRIAPAFAATLWKGARLTLQPIFPIVNNLSDISSNNHQRYIQIGNANLSQQIMSTKHWHLSAAAGFFFEGRLGFQAEAEYHLMRNLDLSINGGYTADANYTKQQGFGVVRESGGFNFMAKADYYEPNTKLQIELQGGRFIYGDYGGRLDVTRHFGEYAIGVYGILTGGEHNAGFHFAVPLGGKRQKRDTFIRLRLPEYFAWEYSMVSYFKYWNERMGRRYVTQPDENHAAHYWEPAFVEEYIKRILNGNFK